MQQVQNAEQQARAASNTELATARSDYDTHLSRQQAVLGRVDVAGLVQQMQRHANELDKGEQERDALEGGGGGADGLSVREVKQLVDKYKEKRAELHEAEMRASAAAQLKQ